MNLEDKKITIIGGKRSGMALAHLAVNLKARARISENGSASCFNEEFKEWACEHDVLLEFGGHTREFIEDADVVVVSPGVRLDVPPIQWAKEKGILVLGEIEFSYQFCSRPIIAVTGSLGKTTVVTLIDQIINHAGYKSQLCGNVGTPFSDVVLNLDDKDYVVLEVSSFQLESLLEKNSLFRNHEHNDDLFVKGFTPHIAVFLNFSENHLDRHKDLQEYFDAKKKIFMNQSQTDSAVLNKKDARVSAIASEVESGVVYFNDGSPVQKKFSNLNYAAAFAVVQTIGISEDICREVFMRFRGVEHRVEKARELGGVEFINDSKSTTALATCWALERVDKPILMICGGRDKNIDFSVITELVKNKVKKIFAIGEARGKISRTFKDVVIVEECESLEQAVMKARENAQEGDCVLLSPMCASFDMFSDYEDRGRSFKSIVNALE